MYLRDPTRAGNNMLRAGEGLGHDEGWEGPSGGLLKSWMALGVMLKSWESLEGC